MAAHLARTPLDELVETGHVDPESTTSLQAALLRSIELGVLDTFGSIEPPLDFCSDHTNDDGPACPWNDAAKMHEALYDFDIANPQTGARRAHILEGASA